MTEKRVKVKELYNFGVDTKAKQLYTKTTVDDIIGLIKTDELTNSVTLKKEAQLSICEKRLIELEKENEQLKKELYDITIDYYTETYYENGVRRDEHIKDFKEEFKAKYGDVE